MTYFVVTERRIPHYSETEGTQEPVFVAKTRGAALDYIDRQKKAWKESKLMPGSNYLHYYYVDIHEVEGEE